MLLVLLLAGCPDDPQKRVDQDGDGWSVEQGDCDDALAAVNPGAAERCDGVDEDCDGEVDRPPPADAPAWYADDDGDGAGAGEPIQACTAPYGAVATVDDCDDADAAVAPGLAERCDDVDQDCDPATPACLDSALVLDGDSLRFGNSVTVSAGWLTEPGGELIVADPSAKGGDGEIFLFDPGALPAAGLTLADAAVHLLGSYVGGGLGSGMADAGGLFGEPGVILGARHAENVGAGVMSVVFGLPASELVSGSLAGASRAIWGDLDGVCLGYFTDASATAPTDVTDLDGDGQDDLLVSGTCPEGGDPGQIFVFLGPLDGERYASDADDVWIDPSGTEALGLDLAAGPDLSGDGLPDVAIGAPRAEAYAGLVYLTGWDPALPEPIRERASMVLSGSAPDDTLGEGLVGLDVGFALAAPGADAGSGAIYVLDDHASGVYDASARAAARILGDTADGFGAPLAAGDTDGDGIDDLLAMSAFSDAHLYFGPFSGERAAYQDDETFAKPVGAVAFGHSLTLGDVDADGRADVVVGSPNGGSAGGRVHVMTRW